MEFKEHRVNQGQGNLLVREYPGEGAAYIGLHGFPDNLHIFDEWAPLMANAGRRVVTLDFLGFGGSDKSSNFSYGFDQQLNDLECVVDVLRLGRVIPVAHDAGDRRRSIMRCSIRSGPPVSVYSIVFMDRHRHCGCQSSSSCSPQLICPR